MDVGGRFFPDDLTWLSKAGAFVWQIVILPTPIPWPILVIAWLYWYRLISDKRILRREVESLQEKLAQPKAESNSLSVEESGVMHALAMYDGPMDMDDLQHYTDLSRLRLSHGVTSLIARGYVTQHQATDSSMVVSPTYEGTAFMIANNLDNNTPPGLT